MRYLASVTSTFATLTQYFSSSLKVGDVTMNRLNNVDTERLAELRADLKCPVCNSQLKLFFIVLIRNTNIYISYEQNHFQPWRVASQVQRAFYKPRQFSNILSFQYKFMWKRK